MARCALVVAATSLVLAACGGGDGTTDTADSATPAATAIEEPGNQVDPLEGEWRTEFTCEDSLRAIERSGLSADQIRVQLLRDPCCPTGSLHTFVGSFWGGNPTKDDPCHGTGEARSLVVRFEDGTLRMPDPDVVGVEYELVDDHTIIVTDPSDNVCPPGVECRWQFDLAGDELTFDVGQNIGGIMTWEAAPFQRIG
jgi:hypothetical protein